MSYPDVPLICLKTIKGKRGLLGRRGEFFNYVGLAESNLRGKVNSPQHAPQPEGRPDGVDAAGRILVAFDSDNDRPCELGAHLKEWVIERDGAYAVSTCLAVVEYETWLVAGAEGFSDELVDPRVLSEMPDQIDEKRLKKKWLKDNLRSRTYSPTVDQKRLTNRFDIAKARTRSRSFDRFCRVIEGWWIPLRHDVVGTP